MLMHEKTFVIPIHYMGHCLIEISNYRTLKDSGPEVIKHFPCSSQLSTKFILLIKVKMQTIISMINTSSERLKKQEASLFLGILVFMSS